MLVLISSEKVCINDRCSRSQVLINHYSSCTSRVLTSYRIEGLEIARNAERFVASQQNFKVRRPCEVALRYRTQLFDSNERIVLDTMEQSHGSKDRKKERCLVIVGGDAEEVK